MVSTAEIRAKRFVYIQGDTSFIGIFAEKKQKKITQTRNLATIPQAASIITYGL